VIILIDFYGSLYLKALLYIYVKFFDRFGINLLYGTSIIGMCFFYSLQFILKDILFKDLRIFLDFPLLIINL